MLKDLEPFNYEQIIIIHVYKQMNYDSFKNKITYKLFTYKSYIKPFNSIQINEL